MPKAISQAQARLFGAIAAGKAIKRVQMSSAEAKTRLRGVKVSSLTAKKTQK